jgi:hypothetical protein
MLTVKGQNGTLANFLVSALQEPDLQVCSRTPDHSCPTLATHIGLPKRVLERYEPPRGSEEARFLERIGS